MVKRHSPKTNRLTRQSPLSKRQLIYVVIIFAAVGGFVLYKSLADVITNPTHIIDAQYNFPGSGYDLTSLSTDMSPQTDPSPDGYFYATEFYYLNNFTGYMGLQDEGNAGDGITYPKTAMISIYGATGVSAASSAIGNCGDPSGEGQECALHVIYNWVPGHTYRFNFSLQTANNGAGNEVWGTTFTDLQSGASVYMGSLNVPTTWQYLGHSIIMFHERFSGATANCSNIKPSFVSFSNAKANNGALTGTTDSSYLRSGVNTTACPGYLDNYVQNNVVYSGYGPNITAYAPKTNTSPPANTAKPNPPPAASKPQSQPASSESSSTPKSTTSSDIKSASTSNLPVLSQQPTSKSTSPAVTHSHLNWRYFIPAVVILIVLALILFKFIKSRLSARNNPAETAQDLHGQFSAHPDSHLSQPYQSVPPEVFNPDHPTGLHGDS